MRRPVAGHLDQAQQMMTQVLADHPNSAKAHYVQAELYAREGKAALARSELGNGRAAETRACPSPIPALGAGAESAARH